MKQEYIEKIYAGWLAKIIEERESVLYNTDESSYTGARSLKFVAQPVQTGESVYVYRKTYYRPKDFHDSRYDPSFSPLVYPGQRL